MKLKNARLQEIMQLFEREMDRSTFLEEIEQYHESDIADALQLADSNIRKKIYPYFDEELLAEIFTYFDHAASYIEELDLSQAITILNQLDSDDALSILEDIDDQPFKKQLLAKMDKEAFKDIRFIASFPQDTVGHMMSTNFVTIQDHFTIKEAMRSIIEQAQENDNVNTIFVLDDHKQYVGVVHLKDLIIAREYTPLNDIVYTNHPLVYVNDSIEENIEQLKDYGEDFIPVLNQGNKVVGIITIDDIMQAFDEEMGEDYARLAGLQSEEDLNESMITSVKKRMPWLVLLLGLGLVVSSVVGIFEGIVAQVSILILFQSLILDMAGNVGTQSLAVTIRILMDENISGHTKWKFMMKETKIGGTNGFILGVCAFIVVCFYLIVMKHYDFYHGSLIAGCVSFSLFLAMLISAFVGTTIPIIFHKIHIDPAVASGPLITTINDLVAVVTYYGLAGLLLIHLL